MVTGNSDKQKRLQRKKIYVKEKGICKVNFFCKSREKNRKRPQKKKRLFAENFGYLFCLINFIFYFCHFFDARQ